MTDRPLRRFERALATTAKAPPPAASVGDPAPPNEKPETATQTDPSAGGVGNPGAVASLEPDRNPSLPAADDGAKQEVQTAARQEKEQEAARERIAAMLLEDWEKAFISALYPFISTPRIAKRFFNIYRLLRVTAAKDDAAFEHFIQRESGVYRVVLLLLAISVGRADSGPQILTDISSRHTRAKSLRSWLGLAAESYKKEWLALFEARTRQNGETGVAISPSEREEQLEKLANAATEIHDSVNDVAKRLKASDLALADDLLQCRDWSCDVGRYSFGWHLTSEQ